MSCNITFESIITFRENDKLLILHTSTINVEFYSLSNTLFHNFVLHRTENISVFVEACNFEF